MPQAPFKYVPQTIDVHAQDAQPLDAVRCSGKVTEFRNDRLAAVLVSLHRSSIRKPAEIVTHW